MKRKSTRIEKEVVEVPEEVQEPEVEDEEISFQQAVSVVKAPVVTKDKKVKGDEKIQYLNTGGWFTNTTKTRMQQVSHQFNLGYNVFQKDGSWFVDYKGIEKPFSTDKITLER